MQSAVTRAFEVWNVNKVVDGLPAVPDSVVFALIPGQDENAPVNRDEGMPAAEHIRHRAAITQAGILNANAVVYSVVLDTTIGDWDYNWIGLVDSKTNTVLMIVHVRTQQKLKTRNGQQGNSLTRNLSMQFDGAAEATQINVSAETWQIDFSARLFGMDEAHRLAMRDYYGNAAFLNDGFRVSLANGVATVAAGVGYVGGLRARLDAAATLNVSGNTSIWLDVSRQGAVTGAWENRITLTAAPALADYIDHTGFAHYVARLGEIVNGQLTDSRPVSPLVDLDNRFLKISDAHEKYAPLQSPALVGRPTAPTASQDANDTQLATTAFVRAAISALVNGSPAALDTLDELAAALGNDPEFSVTVLNALAGKLDKSKNGADIQDKKQFAINANVPHLGSGWVDFGGSAGNWTTSQFIAFLESMDAFRHLYFICAGSWSYAVNKKIIDTGCGHIELAGAVVECFSDRYHCKTIRVTTPTTSSDPDAVQGTFIYIDNGADSAPGWRREYNTKNLKSSDVAALGVPMRGDAQMCRAWVRFNDKGEISDAYNVAAVVKNSAGDFTIQFQTPMKNEHYAFTYTVGGRGDSMNMCSGATQLPTVNALRVISVSAQGIGVGGDYRLMDFPVNSVVVFGG